VREIPTIAQKALAINLDSRIYGTFAEIGAGQEVVRTFFQVGGASGTVAKSMSAYDMAFSDAIYGKEESGRYVVETRLGKMLDKEFSLLVRRLDDQRAGETTFFVFADTVAARSYGRRDMECHGWLGVSFQSRPRAEPSHLHVHIRMLDAENQRQQEALGAVGVNLLYGAFFYRDDPSTLTASLRDNIAKDRIEVDMIRFTGPDFAHLDNRLMSLQLIQHDLTEAVMFSPTGELLLPSEVLYKRPVLVQRGSFRPPTHVTVDMHRHGYEQFTSEPDVTNDKDQVVVLKEITMHNLLSDGVIDHSDFLARVDLVGALGNNVLISKYFEYFRLTTFIGRYTKRRIGVVLGMIELDQLFDEKHYPFLEGGLLESFGKLLSRLVRLYVYPWRHKSSNLVTTADNFQAAPHLQALYAYLHQNRWIESLKGVDLDVLGIHSKEILKMIQSGDQRWADYVPKEVAQAIAHKGLFGYAAGYGSPSQAR
jgi:hypothetical protein